MGLRPHYISSTVSTVQYHASSSAGCPSVRRVTNATHSAQCEARLTRSRNGNDAASVVHPNLVAGCAFRPAKRESRRRIGGTQPPISLNVASVEPHLAVYFPIRISHGRLCLNCTLLSISVVCSIERLQGMGQSDGAFCCDHSDDETKLVPSSSVGRKKLPSSLVRQSKKTLPLLELVRLRVCGRVFVACKLTSLLSSFVGRKRTDLGMIVPFQIGDL